MAVISGPPTLTRYLTGDVMTLTYPTCPNCGSLDIVGEAHCMWDADADEWYMSSGPNGYFTCLDCDHEEKREYNLVWKEKAS